MGHLVVFAVGAALAAINHWLVRPRVVAAWKQAARELGFRLTGSGTSGLDLSGRIGDWNVSVSETWREGEPTQTGFRLDGRNIPGQLSLSRERLFYRGQDIPVGDEDFDREICVQGDELKALAVLNRATRSTAREVFARRDVTLRAGSIQYVARGWIKDPEKLKSTIEDLVRLARSLSLAPGTVPERLAENASSDDLASVRLRNLELLHRNFQGTEIAREAFLKALEDRSIEVRLAGAVHLGELERVAKIAGIESADPALRLRAVRHLVNEGGPERAGPLLERLLSTPAPAVLRCVVEGIGQLKYRPATAKLISLIGRADADTAAATAASLGKMRDASAEPALLSLLEREDRAVQVAAARALGEVGTVQAVEPLLALARGLLDSELNRAAREAVGAIQASLGNAERGRLSLADLSEQDGALSVAPEQAGRLSFDEPGSQRALEK